MTISTLAVLDFSNFGLSHCSSKMLDVIKTAVGVDNVAYPEMLGKMVVINAPWLAGELFIYFDTRIYVW